MPKKTDKNLIVGLDIGTSKVVAMVGCIAPDHTLEVIGVGTHLTKGLKKGVVVNIDATVQSIQEAIEEAEAAAGCQIHSVYTGIAGSHIRSFNSQGIVAIRDQEVDLQDVDRVNDAAKAVAIPLDQKILHVLPQEYIIDGQEGIQEPLGMSGVRLESNIHMVTASISATQNIVKCIKRCGLEVDDIILGPLASSYAVLTDDEKQLGVCLIDIGGGTTDIVVFINGAIKHSAIIAVAGDQVTNDIAVALRTPSQEAENIKIQYGCAYTALAHEDDMVEVASMGERHQKRLSRLALAEVIEPRFEELFTLIHAELHRVGLDHVLSAGVVMTGGSARMPGLLELAETVFQTPVRLGVPRNVSGLIDVVRNPIYATSVGLLKYGYHSREQRRAELTSNPGFKGLLGRMKHWFQGNF